MKKKGKKGKDARPTALQSERAMIGGILEGSPDAVGVAVVRMQCGCRKMAAVDKAGEPASKVIMYRDSADSICALCQADNGSFDRVLESFVHWVEPAPPVSVQRILEEKVLGTKVVIH